MRHSDDDEQKGRPEDPLISELRTFVLSYGEHDPDCPGFDATGPAAIDPDQCVCGFIARLEELLMKVSARLR